MESRFYTLNRFYMDYNLFAGQLINIALLVFSWVFMGLHLNAMDGGPGDPGPSGPGGTGIFVGDDDDDDDGGEESLFFWPREYTEGGAEVTVKSPRFALIDITVHGKKSVGILSLGTIERRDDVTYIDLIGETVSQDGSASGEWTIVSVDKATGNVIDYGLKRFESGEAFVYYIIEAPDESGSNVHSIFITLFKDEEFLDPVEVDVSERYITGLDQVTLIEANDGSCVMLYPVYNGPNHSKVRLQRFDSSLDKMLEEGFSVSIADELQLRLDKRTGARGDFNPIKGSIDLVYHREHAVSLANISKGLYFKRVLLDGAGIPSFPPGMTASDPGIVIEGGSVSKIITDYSVHAMKYEQNSSVDLVIYQVGGNQLYYKYVSDFLVIGSDLVQSEKLLIIASGLSDSDSPQVIIKADPDNAVNDMAVIYYIESTSTDDSYISLQILKFGDLEIGVIAAPPLEIEFPDQGGDAGGGGGDRGSGSRVVVDLNLNPPVTTGYRAIASAAGNITSFDLKYVGELSDVDSFVVYRNESVLYSIRIKDISELPDPEARIHIGIESYLPVQLHRGLANASEVTLLSTGDNGSNPMGFVCFQSKEGTSPQVIKWNLKAFNPVNGKLGNLLGEPTDLTYEVKEALSIIDLVWTYPDESESSLFFREIDAGGGLEWLLIDELTCEASRGQREDCNYQYPYIIGKTYKFGVKSSYIIDDKGDIDPSNDLYAFSERVFTDTIGQVPLLPEDAGGGDLLSSGSPGGVGETELSVPVGGDDNEETQKVFDDILTKIEERSSCYIATASVMVNYNKMLSDLYFLRRNNLNKSLPGSVSAAIYGKTSLNTATSIAGSSFVYYLVRLPGYLSTFNILPFIPVILLVFFSLGRISR